MSYIQDVADIVTGAGVPVQKIEEGDGQLDGCIEINDDVWIQVGDCGYFQVSRWTIRNEEVAHEKMTRSLEVAISQVKKLLEAQK